MIYKNVSLRWRNFSEALGSLVCIGGTVFAGAIKRPSRVPLALGQSSIVQGGGLITAVERKRLFLFQM